MIWIFILERFPAQAEGVENHRDLRLGEISPEERAKVFLFEVEQVEGVPVDVMGDSSPHTFHVVKVFAHLLPDLGWVFGRRPARIVRRSFPKVFCPRICCRRR